MTEDARQKLANIKPMNINKLPHLYEDRTTTAVSADYTTTNPGQAKEWKKKNKQFGTGPTASLANTESETNLDRTRPQSGKSAATQITKLTAGLT
jgi:hypothetical protein